MKTCLQLQVEQEDNESNPELELCPPFLPSESSNWALGLILSDGQFRLITSQHQTSLSSERQENRGPR